MNHLHPFRDTGIASFLVACLQNQELRRLPTTRSAWLVQWFVTASRLLRGEGRATNNEIDLIRQRFALPPSPKGKASGEQRAMDNGINLICQRFALPPSPKGKASGEQRITGSTSSVTAVGLRHLHHRGGLRRCRAANRKTKRPSFRKGVRPLTNPVFRKGCRVWCE